MKIAQHFRAFLERYRYLQLPQIGRFEVVGENPMTSENGASTNGIAFLADKNQSEDAELVEFISKSMRVESCVAVSDLSSFISSLRELLILGFEVEIPGVGYLHFEPNNILQFSGKNIYKKTIQKRWKRTRPAMSSSFWL
jgi:hypothetical protein